MLHANQPSVPEATPAPGYERPILTQRADQLVPTSTAQGKDLVILSERTQTFNFGTPEVVDGHYRKRKKCHVLEILSRFAFQLWMASLKCCLTWIT